MVITASFFSRLSSKLSLSSAVLSCLIHLCSPCLGLFLVVFGFSCCWFKPCKAFGCGDRCLAPWGLLECSNRFLVVVGSGELVVKSGSGDVEAEGWLSE